MFCTQKRREQTMSDEKTPMTSGKYAVEFKGKLCPLCRSDDISASSNVLVYSDMIYRRVECLHCGAFWHEPLKVIGYTSLHRRVVTYQLTKRGE